MLDVILGMLGVLAIGVLGLAIVTFVVVPVAAMLWVAFDTWRGKI